MSFPLPSRRTEQQTKVTRSRYHGSLLQLHCARHQTRKLSVTKGTARCVRDILSCSSRQMWGSTRESDQAVIPLEFAPVAIFVLCTWNPRTRGLILRLGCLARDEAGLEGGLLYTDRLCARYFYTRVLLCLVIKLRHAITKSTKSTRSGRDLVKLQERKKRPIRR
jgi:hypothetical protein